MTNPRGFQGHQRGGGTHTIHIYLHECVIFYGTCREIYHTWMLWGMTGPPKRNPKTKTVHLRSYLERETNPKPSGKEWNYFTYTGEKLATFSQGEMGFPCTKQKWEWDSTKKVWRKQHVLTRGFSNVEIYTCICIYIYKHLKCYSTYQGNACCG